MEERTYVFSRNVIAVCKAISQNQVNKGIVGQLLRAATSVGANYCEANGASSRMDFRNKIHICKKEAQESNYWLRLLFDSNLGQQKEIAPLVQESHELTLIFGKIVSTMKTPKSKFNIRK
jgi:four helix bundle protein